MAKLDKRDKKQEIIAAVENYFEIDKIRYEPFDENDVAHATYAIQSKFKHADVLFQAYDDRLVLRMILPLRADDERVKVGEFLHRANYGLNNGNFDFDFNDGEISYRMAIYCGVEEFAPPTYEQIDFALIVGLMMIDKYGDALIKVMFGLVEPVDAIETIEN